MKSSKAVSLCLVLLAAALGAAPALSEPARKTELVALDGGSVERLPLRYDFDAAWVVDAKNILYRDTSRDYYLVTLKTECSQIVRRGFSFFPSWSWQLLATSSYEVRPEAGPYCSVARIDNVDDAKAIALRDRSRRRAW